MYETIPGLGYVAEHGSMNNAQVADAIRYNSNTPYALSSGAPYAITSEQFAKALFGLQAQMYSVCDAPSPGGPTARLGGSCSNIDGKYGPDPQQALDALPAPSGAGQANALESLIAIANGSPSSEMSPNDIAAAAQRLGVRKGAGTLPVPDNGDKGLNGNGNGKKKDDKGNIWLVLGAAAIGLGILYHVTKKKR